MASLSVNHIRGLMKKSYDFSIITFWFYQGFLSIPSVLNLVIGVFLQS